MSERPNRTSSANFWVDCSPQATHPKINGAHGGWIQQSKRERNRHITYSCYAPTSTTFAEYEQILRVLVLNVTNYNGDFNAWVLEWGSGTKNVKRCALLE